MTSAARGGVTARLRSLVPAFLALVVIGVVLVLLDWAAINHANVEAGDFAANSLQIQDAKQLHLLDGHYSRFGFHHPGPALLYLLAFGEWLFHDLTGLVPSGLSGQLVAIAFFDAFWIVAIYRIARTWSKDWRLPLLSTLVFLLTVTLYDHEFINGIWFPLIYPLPFAVFLLSLAALCSGRPRSVLFVALTAGILINGHASFIPILVVVGVLMLGFNWLSYRADTTRRVLSRQFMRTNSSLLLVALAVFAVLMLPLGILTVVDFPGPLVEYLRFGGGQGEKSLADALRFTARFWGGFPQLAVAMLIMILLTTIARTPTGQHRIVRGLVAACASATIAVFVYALFGVDAVENTYLGYFAYTIPGILAMTIITALWPRTQARVGNITAALIATALAAVTLTQHVPRAFPPDYDRPEIAALQERLAGQKGEGRIVLDLDNSGDWMTVWSTIIGVDVINRRLGSEQLCIDENWNIAFSEQARCTADELRGSVRYRVSAGLETSGSADIQLAGVTLTREPRR